MIIDKKIVVKLNSISKSHYRKIGYIIDVDVKEIEIDVLDLPKHSKNRVNCKCCNCDKVKKVYYSAYNKQTDFGKTEYYCLDCKSVKYKNTMMKNYGVENISQLNDIKDKKKEKSLLIYGCECPFQSEDVKNKIKKVNLEKYGVKSPLQNLDIMNKLKQTNIERYGVENVFQNEDIKDKIEKNNMEKYGVNNLNKLDSQKLKIKNSIINKYGVHHSQLIEVQEKLKNTCLEKYGNENWNNRDKSRETCLQKYGVEYPMQNLDVFNKQLKTSFSKKQFNELIYQGSYELDFLKKYEYLEISKCKPIEYFFNDKIRIYYPDFYYENLNLIIEIKSDYIYYKYLDINLAKQNACINNGYTFLFIINKNYEEFDKLIN